MEEMNENGRNQQQDSLSLVSRAKYNLEKVIAPSSYFIDLFSIKKFTYSYRIGVAKKNPPNFPKRNLGRKNNIRRPNLFPI